MAYIGPEPNPGQNREVDDISSSFNGSTTAFTLQVNSQNVSPGSSNNIIVSLGGVVQNPSTDFTINSSTITFSTAPASGLSFFGLVLGQQVDIQSVADSASIVSPTLSAPTVTGDLSIADKIIHTGDTNTAIRFPAADTVTVETAGSERMRITGDGPHLLLGGTSDVNEITESSANAGIVIGGTGFGNGGLAIITSNSGTGRIYFGDEVGNNAGRNKGQINYGHSDNHMRFVTDSSERIRILSSGGITFNGDTAAANALDDYEEGTWTPAISGVSYSDTQGTYIKIGTTCFVTLTLNGANTSAGGADTRITGLPFTPKVGPGEYYPANSIPFFEVSSISLASGYNNIYGRIDDSQGNIQLLVTDGESHGILTAGGGTTLNSNHALRTSFTYQTA